MRHFAHDLSSLTRTEDIRCDEDVGFDVLSLSNNVLRGLEAIGFKRPSPVQLRAIPYGRCGVDMVVQSKSGTGKTCVFSVVALESIDVARALQVIVLAPTHEIAQQDSEVVQAIGRKIPNLVVATCVGGHNNEKKKLKTCHIVIGSPGRIRHLIQKQKLSVHSVRLFVLDEADFLVTQDKMRADVNWICSSLPENRQTIALSATFSTQLAEYVGNYMDNPVHVKLCAKSAVLLGVQQLYHYVSSVPFDGSYSRAKFSAVKDILDIVEFRQCIIFYNNHEKADSLVKELAQWKPDWPIAFISSQLDPVQRAAAFIQFRQGKCRILVSSDLICRGADAKDVDLVIHLDFPRSVDTYLHRVGRAGRFGSQGVSIGIVALSQEFDLIQKYQEKLEIQIPQLAYPPPKDLITSCDVKLPSCRIGDIVTADKIETRDLPNLSSSDTTSMLSPETIAQDLSQPSFSLQPFEDEGAGYSDMLASYDDVNRFLNLDNTDFLRPSFTSSSLKAVKHFEQQPKLHKSTSSQDTSSGNVDSESSQIAHGYCTSFTEASASLDSLVKKYGVIESEPCNVTESRSTSAATITVLKDHTILFTPIPTPSRSLSMTENKCKDNAAKNTALPSFVDRNFCDKSMQTEDAGCGASMPDLHYIPMPPLMTAGGYSEFAEWLQLHGSLVYAPVRNLASTCQCACHSCTE